MEKIKRDIDSLIVEEAFQRVLDGGPLGREGQLFLTRRTPGFSYWGPAVTYPEIVQKRQLLWEARRPWTGCLANHFDTTQEEVESQYLLLNGTLLVEAEYV